MSADKDDILQPGQEIRPQMGLDTAADIVRRLYGLKVKTIQELNSYDDKNYLVTAESEFDNPHIKQLCGDGYVLKVLNSMDSKKTHVEGEHEVLKILLDEGFNVPVPILNMDGKDLSREKIASTSGEGVPQNNNADEGKVHIVRLLTYIPGVVLHKVPYTAEILREVGQYIGRLDKSLRNYHHPALEGPSIWDLKNVPQLKEFVYAVKDDKKRALVNEVLAAFNDVVVPVMDKLPRGAIHGDFNEQNIIVKENPGQEDKGPANKKYHLNGAIDYGDARISCYVFEVAITICYMMIEGEVVDPLECGGHVLSGYLTEMELNDLERDVLKECVAGRFITSLVMGAYTYMQDPGNEYVLVTALKGWARLQCLWDTPKDELYRRWKNVIESYSKQSS